MLLTHTLFEILARPGNKLKLRDHTTEKKVPRYCNINTLPLFQWNSSLSTADCISTCKSQNDYKPRLEKLFIGVAKTNHTPLELVNQNGGLEQDKKIEACSGGHDGHEHVGAF